MALRMKFKAQNGNRIAGPIFLGSRDGNHRHKQEQCFMLDLVQWGWPPIRAVALVLSYPFDTQGKHLRKCTLTSVAPFGAVARLV
jgi:hypothetical protein